MFCPHCRRERQFSVGNNEESASNYEVLNFSTSTGQLTVHKGKCLGKQNNICSLTCYFGSCCFLGGGESEQCYQVQSSKGEKILLWNMKCHSQDWEGVICKITL